MIVYFPCSQLINEETIKKQQSYLAVTEFRKELANRGMNVRDRIVVDFKARPGQIMCSSYPPVMWTKTMRTMSFRNLDTDEYRTYVNMRDHYRRTGGIKVRTQDPITGEVKIEKITKSGLILPS